MLCERYNEKGRYIQAWGEFNVGTPYVKIIVDTMLNLPLLFWASETTGERPLCGHCHRPCPYLRRLSRAGGLLLVPHLSDGSRHR